MKFFKNLQKDFNNTRNKNLTCWKANNKDYYFKKYSNTQWIESLNGTEFFILNVIKSEITNQLVLNDPNRKLFIKLENYNAKFGFNRNNFIKSLLGSWCITLSKITSWKQKDADHYFGMISFKRWLETINGNEFYTLDLISTNNLNVVTLYDPKRKIYFSLTENYATYGATKENQNSFMFGEWIFLSD